MKQLFDSNCILGRRAIHAPLGQPLTAGALIREMDRLGIAEALVVHAMAIDGHPADGNERLMREIEGRPRLRPCWVLLPTCGEMPPPQELVAQMKKRGVRAARKLQSDIFAPLSRPYQCGLVVTRPSIHDDIAFVWLFSWRAELHDAAPIRGGKTLRGLPRSP